MPDNEKCEDHESRTPEEAGMPVIERGAVLVSGCDCSEGECWEVRCTDCGRVLEAYDDDLADNFVAHWPDRDMALDDCTAHGFEWWDDEPDQPVLCGGCIDRRRQPNAG